MQLKVQKRLAADIMKCSPKRVSFDTEKLEEIKEAITKFDVRTLINNKVITKKPVKGVSRARAMKKKKGGRGKGSRKGAVKARTPKKRKWVNKIKLQRKFIKDIRDRGIISKATYRSLYTKAKGGFFRSKKHIKLYIEENKLAIKKEK